MCIYRLFAYFANKIFGDLTNENGIVRSRVKEQQHSYTFHSLNLYSKAKNTICSLPAKALFIVRNVAEIKHFDHLKIYQFFFCEIFFHDLLPQSISYSQILFTLPSLSISFKLHLIQSVRLVIFWFFFNLLVCCLE